MPIASEKDYLSGLTYLQQNDPVSFPTMDSPPSTGYLGDIYFTGAYYKYYNGAGVWSDLGNALSQLPVNIVDSTNLNSNIYSTSALGLYGAGFWGTPGISTLVSRGDHRHDTTGFAMTGDSSNSLSKNGNTWYGYQSQQLDNRNIGGWGFSDYAQVLMSASNVGFQMLQSSPGSKDPLQYLDGNANVLFRIAASGQTVIGSSSAAISNAALTIRPVNAGLPGIMIRANSAQTANLQEWQNSSAASVVAITSAGNLALSNVSAHPATPAVGGLLYASAGALVWKGSAGTISQIAPA